MRFRIKRQVAIVGLVLGLWPVTGEAKSEFSKALCQVGEKTYRTEYERAEPPFSLGDLRRDTLKPLTEGLADFLGSLTPADRQLLDEFRAHRRRSIRRIELQEVYWKNPAKWGNSLETYTHGLPVADQAVLAPESLAELNHEVLDLDPRVVQKHFRELAEDWSHGHDRVLCRDGQWHEFEPTFCRPVRQRSLVGGVIIGATLLFRRCEESWDSSVVPAVAELHACAEIDLLAPGVAAPPVEEIFAKATFGGKPLKGSLADRYASADDYVRESLPAECTAILGLKKPDSGASGATPVPGCG